MKCKYIVYCTYHNFVCAGIKQDHPAYQSDTNSTHFSFAVYDVDPEDFAKVIEDFVAASRDNENYRQEKFVELQSYRSSDTIRLQLDHGIVSITRGNLKVLFYGHIGILEGLPKAIRKAIIERDTKHEKEQDD